MADRPNYTLEDNPVYTEEIPAIQNDDDVSADKVVNPLITKILNNQKANHQLAQAAKSSADSAGQTAGKAIPLTQKGAANGVPTLDSAGKIPKAQLPTVGGYVRQSSSPSDSSLLWIDSGNSNKMKYYNGSSWVPVPATWG
ncbi:MULTISPECIES: hypothetical protein [Caproicibacterium]|uniref:Uncharacterized protein n=1 Tax=Caproicibacterium argilliputei TaxID=3030016 RepID=A0AA97DDF8_9FIRM|nr:hypothetical protein [Caproicibacterium argilliputei]WOC33490.1 hypothetical protein PXC00_06385 [Caproicibacterium argilliputei]